MPTKPACPQTCLHAAYKHPLGTHGQEGRAPPEMKDLPRLLPGHHSSGACNCWGGSYLFAQKGSWGTKWVFLFAAMYRLMIVRLCCKGWECGMGDIPSIGTKFCA